MYVVYLQYQKTKARKMKPYLHALKWMGIMTVLFLSFWVFNFVNPWLGTACAILTIVFIAQQIIKLVTKNQ